MKRQTVSLCLIARDEEATIGMTIKSVLALVDEVIVVDTGSADNTRIIAEGYGARVVDVAWSDDFSEARNVALGEASCDWVLVLDADEFLQPIRPVEFQRLLHDPGVAGYRLKCNGTGAGEAAELPRSLRLFRNAAAVRYRYPIFEQIEPSLELWAQPQGLIITDCDLVILSEGNNNDRRSRQRERNLRILRKAQDAHPREPYFPYKLACEGIHRLDDEVLPVAGLNRSLGYLNQAWRQVSHLEKDQVESLIWLPDLAVNVGSGLLTLNRIREAEPVVHQVARLFPDNPALNLQAAVVELRSLEKFGHDDQREPRAQRVDRLVARLHDLGLAAGETNLLPEEKRLHNLYPLRYLGELALLEGKVSEAVGYFERALSLDPEYSFGWLGMAECSRFAGDRKRALKLYLRTVTENQWNHRAWLRGCDLMLKMDFHDNAASWWRQVATRFPEHPEVVAGGIDGVSRAPAQLLNG
jgi:tetratricopeptide (TPR) repeat protein